MGLLRKMTSITTLGAVDFRSDKERTARYAKQARNELRAERGQQAAQSTVSRAEATVEPDWSACTVIADSAHWLGDENVRAMDGPLYVSGEIIGIKASRRRMWIRLSRTTSVDVRSEAVGGVITERTLLTCHATDGTLDRFAVDIRVEELLQTLSPFLQKVGLPTSENGEVRTVHAGSRQSLADEIRKLAELHASGGLTDDEFSAAKAKLFES